MPPLYRFIRMCFSGTAERYSEYVLNSWTDRFITMPLAVLVIIFTTLAADAREAGLFRGMFDRLHNSLQRLIDRYLR